MNSEIEFDPREVSARKLNHGRVRSAMGAFLAGKPLQETDPRELAARELNAGENREALRAQLAGRPFVADRSAARHYDQSNTERRASVNALVGGRPAR